MRFEIKFRIWDINSKDFVHKGYTLANGGGILRYGKDVEDPSQFIVHFFSGMLDKYNKEIFETDIVEHTLASGGELKPMVGIVRYDPSRAQFILNDGQKNPLADLFNLRKIGNPYENTVLYDLYVKNKEI